MKTKMLFVAFMGVITTQAFAVPSHITPNDNGGYTVTYDYKDKAKDGWYVVGRAELSFLNWKNKYDSDYPYARSQFSEDIYSFEPVFGGSLAAGWKFNYLWRIELEGGYIGRFTDKDLGFEFTLSAPYAIVNGYRDFLNGFYLGAGIGAALPITTLDSGVFMMEGGPRSENRISPMGSIMVGFAKELDYNLTLDIRYRLAGLMGTTHTRDFEWFYKHDPNVFYQSSIENKIGLILDNSISIGLRYEF